MIRTTLAGVAVAALLAATPQARAQVGGNNQTQISFGAVARAPVGAWAEYAMSARGVTMHVRYALVERNPGGFGIETATDTQVGKMLMRLDYVKSGADAFKLGRARMRVGGVTREMTAPVMKGAAIQRKGNLGKLIGHEQVKVAAGTFGCSHYRMTTSRGSFDFWVSDHVFPTGIVKLTTSTGMSGELVSHGTGAKPELN